MCVYVCVAVIVPISYGEHKRIRRRGKRNIYIPIGLINFIEVIYLFARVIKSYVQRIYSSSVLSSAEPINKPKYILRIVPNTQMGYKFDSDITALSETLFPCFRTQISQEQNANSKISIQVLQYHFFIYRIFLVCFNIFSAYPKIHITTSQFKYLNKPP